MRYVRYIGLAHARMILADEWKTVGIDAETVVWDHTNGFHVPADQFTDEQMRKVIGPDMGFVVVGTDEEPEALPHAMTPAQASAPRVNMMAAVGAEDGSGGDGDADTPEHVSTGVSGASTTTSRRGTTGRGSGKDA